MAPKLIKILKFTRLLYTRVLLLRPFLLGTMTLSDKDKVISMSLDVETLRHGCNLCVTAAQQLIEVLADNLQTPYRLSGWHSVHRTSSPNPSLLITCQIKPKLSYRKFYDSGHSSGGPKVSPYRGRHQISNNESALGLLYYALDPL